VIIRGHAFIQNLRRGHYKLGVEARNHHHLRLAAAFDELISIIYVYIASLGPETSLSNHNATAPESLIRQDKLVKFADKYRIEHPDGFVDFRLDSTDALSDRRTGDVEQELRKRPDKSGPKVRTQDKGGDDDGIGDLFFGGKHMTGPGGCTSGFGVWKSGQGGGYSTAGHCGTGTWTVNGNSSSNV
jgi:hypothetical protein